MPRTPDPAPDAAVDAVRRFNRFQTRLAGALAAPWLDSGLSLAQARVLYELAHRERPGATDLAAALALDPGYLSRLIGGLRARGWVAAAADGDDARRRALRLTPAGRRAFDALQRAARVQVGGWLAPLSAMQRAALLEAMATVERLLGPAAGERAAERAVDGHRAPSTAAAHGPAFVLRAQRPGDLGWVVQRHGALYAMEYGWDWRFEALVAGIVARFVERHDPARECCRIAERDGEPVGSVFVVRESARVAKLRLLLVEPSARGLGLGRALVREAMRFAREAGYRRMVLWTNEVLVAARAIYVAEGFELLSSEPHESFGASLVGEHWSRPL
jgi:DNA-binding MarR family transcriptional regulator/GNAT superfamily N-acetyltransferase